MLAAVGALISRRLTQSTPTFESYQWNRCVDVECGQRSPSPFFWIICEDVHKTLSVAIVMFPMLELELRLVELDMVLARAHCVTS